MSADAQITMLEAGADISFANCGLPYYIGGDIKSRSKLILQSPESFKDQYNVEVHTHTVVTTIDSQARVVSVTNTQTGKSAQFEYTKLILAQGGRPVTPTLPGANLNHVFTLWTLDDMDKINRHITERKPRTAVVVGGGFIGLEMVEALVKRGLQVHVIEMMPHVMSLMDAEVAGFVQNELQHYGVSVHTGIGVKEIASSSVKLDDGTVLDADLVLLSIGVRPTLQLAKDAGLEIGESGGLLVNEYLQTSNPHIYAAGDMIEIEHRVTGKKVRIPLAGPANRQGRIAAENVLGANHAYKGALGTSVVRVFEAVAGITGLSLKQARALGFEADAVVVHKEHHTSYYPGSEPVTVFLVYDKKTGRILGGQTAGYKGADKRLDVIATAAAAQLTVSDLADTDFAYSPPIGTANDALNMAAYTAENKMSGYSPSCTVSELDALIDSQQTLIVDVRDVFAFEKQHIEGATNIPLELLNSQLQTIARDKTIVLYDETGKKAHQALRTLLTNGFTKVCNISGGFTSVQRYARTLGFKSLRVKLLPLDKKSLHANEQEETSETQTATNVEHTTALIIDVRSVQEFKTGAVPKAVNIPLDELERRIGELGNDPSRDITVYCASGARSAYAQQFLQQRGFSKVKNGGGVMQMMAQLKAASNTTKESSNEPLIIDVRTVQEFKGGAFPGAINIPLDELPAKLSQLGTASRPIVVYCASGARSAYAQQFLAQNGFTNVKNGGGLMQMMKNRK